MLEDIRTLVVASLLHSNHAQPTGRSRYPPSEGESLHDRVWDRLFTLPRKEDYYIIHIDTIAFLRCVVLDQWLISFWR